MSEKFVLLSQFDLTQLTQYNLRCPCSYSSGFVSFITIYFYTSVKENHLGFHNYYSASFQTSN